MIQLLKRVLGRIGEVKAINNDQRRDRFITETVNEGLIDWQVIASAKIDVMGEALESAKSVFRRRK